MFVKVLWVLDMVLDVVGYGAINFDYINVVDELATGDQQAVITETHGLPGGSATNTIFGLATLGVNTGFLGAVGGDTEGAKILKNMQNMGMDISRIKKLDAEFTSKVFVYVDSSGERAMYSLPGASIKLQANDQDIEWLKTSKFTVISSLPGKDQVRKIQKVVEEIHENTKIIFMPGGLYSKYGYSELKKIISMSYMLILNRRELQELTGQDPNNGSKWLLNHGAQRVAVTLGEEGCLVNDNNNHKIIPTPKLPPDQIVDSTGAGDAFAAGLIFGMLHGKSLPHAALCGNLTARAAVQALGAQVGLLNKDELMREFERYSKEIFHDEEF
jgi:ribokinase